LLDGVSTQPVRNAQVVYSAKEILFVGGADNSPPPDLLNPGQRRPDADLSDYTLLPGLIEAHAHLFLEGGELNLAKRSAYLKQTPEALLTLAQTRLGRLVGYGITAVRDAGDKDGVGLALSKACSSRRRGEAQTKGGKRKAEGGKLDQSLVTSAATGSITPYIDSPGAAIHRKGRYGGFMGEPIENHSSLRECVEARVNAGADRIKLIATGIIDFKQGRVVTEPQLSAQEVRELVGAAATFGKQTFAHASGDTGIENVVEGGVDSVEHGFFVRDDQLAKMHDRQIAWVPTFAPVQVQLDHAGEMGWDEAVVSNLRRILDQHAASLVKAERMGVRVIAGSDAGACGVAHGHGFLYELELMERAGLSALTVINTATGNSSNRLGYREKFGQIKPGYLSRFILTRHSPLESVSYLRRQKFIVFDDAVFGSDEVTDIAGL
jgi:imidazolonepropionase-like amidohydrolase